MHTRNKLIYDNPGPFLPLFPKHFPDRLVFHFRPEDVHKYETGDPAATWSSNRPPAERLLNDSYQWVM